MLIRLLCIGRSSKVPGACEYSSTSPILRIHRILENQDMQQVESGGGSLEMLIYI